MRSIPVRVLALAAAFALAAVPGCSSKKVVTRIDPSTVTDLSGRWNDTDSRQVSEAMIKDCLGSPWIAQHMSDSNGKAPAVIVGIIRNKSSEHIATDTFIGDIERALVNSGRVNLVAGRDVRDQLRDEKQDQQDNASAETVKRFGREKGADYMMTGIISSIEDQEGGDQVTYYQVDLTLSNIETGVQSWIGQQKIKKFISRSKYKG